MKIQIRQGTFETNSSSQHTLVITKTNEYLTTEEICQDLFYDSIPEKTVHISGFDLSFGRSPFRIIHSFYGKLCYAYASLVDNYNDDKHKEILEAIRECIPEVENIVTDVQEQTIFKKEIKPEKWGAMYRDDILKHIKDKFSEWNLEDIRYSEEEDRFYVETPIVGYSEDYGGLSKFLKERNITIKEFLTNKKYVIIQDGDEYCEWENAKQSSLINENNIIEEIIFT